jgi:hypothetical protein
VRMNWEWELRWRSRWNIYVGERACEGFRGVLRAFCYYALGFGRQKGVAWLVAYTIPTYSSSQYTLFALRMNTLVFDYLTRLCVKLDCCFLLVLSSSTHV